MLRIHILVGAILAAGLMPGQSGRAAEHCGDVTIASMNWASAELIAAIDKIILSKGYGCNAELIAGDNLPTFASMNDKDEPDLAPELWVNAVGEPFQAAVDEGRLIIAAEILADGGEEGWWIPRYIAEAHPDIKTPADALMHPELFPSPNDGSMGAVHNCPSGWNCQITTANLFRALEGKARGFELVDTGSAAGLDGSIAKAHERKAGWLGFYWAPAAILGRYEMVKLEMGEHDKAEWNSCTALPDCENPQVNGWARNEVFSVVTNEFAEKAGVAMNYLSARSWDNATVNRLLAWMADNQANGEEAARYFLENFEDTWSSWVPEEIKDKVKASL